MIRRNIHRYEMFSNQQLNSLFGVNNSFEREFYDMIRSVFIKYSLQTSFLSFLTNRNGEYGWSISNVPQYKEYFRI
jgi:hypothetical protein